MCSNSKAFEYAKEIVVAKMSSSALSVKQSTGQDVAEFFEMIFNKLVELEKQTSG